MPELRDRLVQRRKTRKGGGSAQWYLPNFDAAGPEVDIFAIPYLDPHREAARQKRLRESPNRGHLPRVRGVETGHVGKTKRSTGHEQSSRKGTDKVDKLKNEKKRSRHAKILEEWDDLAKEERLYKKFRKKKISQAQLDRELYSEDEEI
jgi:ATP-dependent RNA helicase DDX55/SPB4